jgi:hypothetical protein
MPLRAADRRRRAGRAAADHQHVEGVLLADLLGGPGGGAGVQLGEDLLDGHAALAEIPRR